MLRIVSSRCVCLIKAKNRIFASWTVSGGRVSRYTMLYSRVKARAPFYDFRSSRGSAPAHVRIICFIHSNTWFVQYREELTFDLLTCSDYRGAFQ